MFEITKSKGKPYKTDDPAKALEAYKECKTSLSIHHGDTVVRTKCGTGESSSRKHQINMERC